MHKRRHGQQLIAQLKATNLLRHPRPLARVLAEHDEAVAVGGVAACKGGLGLYRHLAGAGCAAELLDAVGVEDGSVAARAVVSSAGEERVRTFYPDVVGVEVVGLSPSLRKYRSSSHERLSVLPVPLMSFCSVS